MLLSGKGKTDLYVWMAASLQRKAFVCVYEYVSVCVCTCALMCMHACMHVHVYKCVPECVHVHMHLCVLCACVCARVYEIVFAHA